MPPNNNNRHSLAASQIPSTLQSYLALLSRHYETVPYLCYGLFEGEDDDLQQAQLRLVGLLERLVAADEKLSAASILVVGSTWRFLAVDLARQGCQVDWLATLPQCGEQLAEVLGDIDCLHSIETERRYDGIIMEGTFEYEAQLRFLNDFRDILKPNGRLCLANEFLYDDSAIAYSPLANCSSFEQLAVRLGYEIETCQDHSEAAQKSIDQCIRLLAREGQSERGGEGCEDAELRAALTLNLSEFNSRRRCFRVYSLCYKPGSQVSYPQARFSSIEDIDGQEIREVFEKSFGVDFDLDLWRWKYLRGDGKGVVARLEKGGDIVAHYGGAPRSIDYFGEPSTAIQVCDVMVMPEKRTSFGRSSLFFKTACTFLEREIGNTVKHLLGFGFPNKKAMNIALRLGLYHKTDDLIELSFEQDFNGKSTDEGEPRLLDLDMDQVEHRQWIDRLWQRMRADFRNGIIGVRDAEYIRYRYFDHPGNKGYHSYFLFQDDSPEPCALVVFKEHEGSLLLMDILCEVGEMHGYLGNLRTLLTSRQLRIGECTGMKLWLTKVPAQQFQFDGVLERDLGISIPCNSWNPGPPVDVLYGKWWLTAGDMDFM